MPQPLHVNDQITVPARELRFTYARSSGPGGQNVNKLNTKARLRWAVADSPALPPAVRERFLTRYATRLNDAREFVIASERHRERGRNERDCLEKLRAMILSVVAAPTRRQRTRPSRAAVEARLAAKRKRSLRKQRRRPPSLD
ncbi:MAG: alternative ribosome rescue aminoacyl-tRNA hydrolase ArfB [Planctomycetota bacterium]